MAQQIVGASPSRARDVLTVGDADVRYPPKTSPTFTGTVSAPPIINTAPVAWEIQRVAAGNGPSQSTSANALKAFTATAFDTVVRRDGLAPTDVTTGTAAVIVPFTGYYDLDLSHCWSANVTSILCFIRTPAGGGAAVVVGGTSQTFTNQSVVTHKKTVFLNAGDTIQPGYWFLNTASSMFGPYPLFQGLLLQRTV